jgi:flagella basal body P-ring formation protein FlgA
MNGKCRSMKERFRTYTGYLFILHFLPLVSLSPCTAGASQALNSVIKNYLIENYPWAETEINNLLVDQDVPKGPPEKIMVEKGLPGKTVFLLEYGNGRIVTASAFVKAFDRVVLTRRAFKKGHVLQKEDLYTILMNVAHLPRGAIQELDLAVGKSLIRSTTANMPVADYMISDSVSVKKGRRVTLVAESPGFSITASGELKETAEIGNTVRAVNLGSRKIVVGILEDEDTVRVTF